MRLLLVLALLLTGCVPLKSPAEMTQAQPPTIQNAPAPAAAPVIAYVLATADGRVLVLDQDREPMAKLAFCGELPGETPALVFCTEKAALGG